MTLDCTFTVFSASDPRITAQKPRSEGKPACSEGKPASLRALFGLCGVVSASESCGMPLDCMFTVFYASVSGITAPKTHSKGKPAYLRAWGAVWDGWEAARLHFYGVFSLSFSALPGGTARRALNTKSLSVSMPDCLLSLRRTPAQAMSNTCYLELSPTIRCSDRCQVRHPKPLRARTWESTPRKSRPNAEHTGQRPVRQSNGSTHSAGPVSEASHVPRTKAQHGSEVVLCLLCASEGFSVWSLDSYMN